MSSSKTTRNWRTGVTGVALILAGVVLLGVQVSPAFASRLHKSSPTHKNWRACNEKVVPFDSYREYVPRLVKVSFPVGDRLAEARLQVNLSVGSALRQVHGAMARTRSEIRQGLEELRVALADARSTLGRAVHDAQLSLRFQLRSLHRNQMRKSFETGGPESRPSHSEEARRQAA